MVLRKRIIIGVFIGILLFIIVYCIIGFLFINWLDIEPLNPIVPKNSSPGKIILASRGCCFWATDVTVSLLDGNGNNTILISEETVYEYDIFECENIPAINAPIQVIIKFTSHYAIEEEVFLTVGEFSNTKELLEKGLLLCFGDGGLTVRNGNNEKNFYAGTFGSGGDESPWYQK